MDGFLNVAEPLAVPPESAFDGFQKKVVSGAATFAGDNLENLNLWNG